LTLEQAVWFRDVQKQTGATNDPSTYNYYAFYPGPPTGISKRRDVTVGKKPEGKGLDPDWGLFGDMFNALKKFGQDILNNINPGSLAQLGARMLRSITDPFVYAGDYIFKGLGSGVAEIGRYAWCYC